MLTLDQVHRLYAARQLDNHIEQHENSRLKFEDYCATRCLFRKVSLPDQSLSVHSARALGSILLENDSLSDLHLAKNRLGDDGARELGTAIGQTRHLVKLDFSNNQLTYRGARALMTALRPNKSLVSLSLASNSGPFKNILGVRGAEAISMYLQSAGADCLLNFLNLKQCCLGNEGVSVLSKGLRRNRSLLALNLSGNGITQAVMKQVSKSLPAPLVDLDLSDNDLKDEGLGFLCHYLYYRREEASDDEDEQELKA